MNFYFSTSQVLFHYIFVLSHVQVITILLLLEGQVKLGVNQIKTLVCCTYWLLSWLILDFLFLSGKKENEEWNSGKSQMRHSHSRRQDGVDSWVLLSTEKAKQNNHIVHGGSQGRKREALLRWVEEIEEWWKPEDENRGEQRGRNCSEGGMKEDGSEKVLSFWFVAFFWLFPVT